MSLTGRGASALAPGALGAFVDFESLGITETHRTAGPCEAGVQGAQVNAVQSGQRALALFLGGCATAPVFVDFVTVIQFVPIAFNICVTVLSQAGDEEAGSLSASLLYRTIG